MKSQNNKEEYDYLISKGFHLEWLDDMSGWWYTKFIETEYFGDVEVNIEDCNDDDGRITVSTYDKTDKTAGIFDFINMPYTREHLTKIINLLTD